MTSRAMGSIKRASGSLAGDRKGHHRRIRSNPVRGIAVTRCRPTAETGYSSSSVRSIT
jgi:hypothetical protein